MFTGGDAKVTALTGTGAGGFCETIGRVSDRLHGTSCVQGSARYVHEHLAASFAMAHMPARATSSQATRKQACSCINMCIICTTDLNLESTSRAEKRRKAAVSGTARGRQASFANSEEIAQR